MHPRAFRSTPCDGNVIGRDSACDIVLTGEQVSRQHADVRLEGLFPVLRDRASRNGIFVNGQRVREHAVGPGDVVRIGEWVALGVEVQPGAAVDDELRAVLPGWYAGPKLQAALGPVRSAAPTDLPVIIQGETGTGKEGVARALHAWSERRGAFVALDCGALPDTLAEGELFGYRRGAFTGAERAHAGLFRAADGGTLFLDEILNLSLPLQAKLLRVLEQRAVIPLGESRPVPVDVRVVCAAQESLTAAARKRTFRTDLLARLDGLTVVLPALRERREDIAALFVRVLADAAGHEASLDASFVEALMLYDWPLNVRELVLVARRLLALHRGATALDKRMLPARIRAPESPPSATVSPRPTRAATDDAAAFAALLAALRDNGGNMSKAASALGISRSRAYRVRDARPNADDE